MSQSSSVGTQPLSVLPPPKRRRREGAPWHQLAWSDTLPTWFRSEAFAEDLYPQDADVRAAGTALLQLTQQSLRLGLF